jgi:arylsulfatase A-like enzyme
VWIVWDTCRADRMSLYGHARPTTPFLDEWSKGARVYDDCISPGSITVTAHASLFTGLMPSEHGASNAHEYLDGSLDTIAELLSRAGYQTYCWAANPHISAQENYTQGFEVVEHPWDERTLARAVEILRAKQPPGSVPADLGMRSSADDSMRWMVKAAGELAREGLVAWLDRRDRERPFFAFLNYMEAHRPLIPPRAMRERTMSPEQVEASYRLDFGWARTWAYSFGKLEIPPEELDLLARLYDAALLELDAHLRDLVGALERGGWLENTLIVVTADHGEHLGDQHLLDHQYSLHQALIRVPLVVHYPARFAPGRDPRPVMSFDLFPTLLELAGVARPRAGAGWARSLLEPADTRTRVSEYPIGFERPLVSAVDQWPGFDPKPWLAGKRALIEAPWKWIDSAAAAPRLFDLARDPGETSDLAAAEPARAQAMRGELARRAHALAPLGGREQGASDDEHQRLLEQLGYGDSARRGREK